MIDFKLVLLILALICPYECIDVCGDWAKFKDIKCIKVLKMKVKGREAGNTCAKYDEHSSVISIHSQEEQDLVDNLLNQFVGTSMGAWIGMQVINGSYGWLDGTDGKFTHWAVEAIKDGTLPCVKVLLNKRYLGKWIDESCERTAHIVCHKEQIFSLNTLKQAIEGMETEISLLKESTIPMGFIYTQLPNQTSPEQLWPKMNWTEVTDEYAGLFFRAEGSESMPFGEIQHANQSWISNRQYITGQPYQGIRSHDRISKNDSLKMGTWVDYPNTNLLTWSSFYTTEGEVRPINAAVKIWQRTG